MIPVPHPGAKGAKPAHNQSILRSYVYDPSKGMCHTDSMTSPDFRDGSPRDRGARTSRGRDVSNAVAERERGRRRLNATTATVGFASVAAAGVVAISLPGSTHAAVTHPGKSTAISTPSKSTGSAGSRLVQFGRLELLQFRL